MATTMQWVRGLLPARRIRTLEGLTSMVADDAQIVVTPSTTEHYHAKMSSIKHFAVRYDTTLPNGGDVYFERSLDSRVLKIPKSLTHSDEMEGYRRAAQEIFVMNEFIRGRRPHVSLEVRTSQEESSPYRPFLKEAYGVSPMANLRMI